MLENTSFWECFVSACFKYRKNNQQISEYPSVSNLPSGSWVEQFPYCLHHVWLIIHEQYNSVVNIGNNRACRIDWYILLLLWTLDNVDCPSPSRLFLFRKAMRHYRFLISVLFQFHWGLFCFYCSVNLVFFWCNCLSNLY